jgi:hypothetical protein
MSPMGDKIENECQAREIARVPEAGRADAAHGPPRKGARSDTRYARRRSGLSQPKRRPSALRQRLRCHGRTRCLLRQSRATIIATGRSLSGRDSGFPTKPPPHGSRGRSGGQPRPPLPGPRRGRPQAPGGMAAACWSFCIIYLTC